MRVRNLALLATTALVGSMAITACDNNNRAALTPQEIGMFGLPVGEPINLISATRGDGVSFDKFQITFNNAEGTNITVTTPEGENITFDLDDPDSWAGVDPRVNPSELARMTSSRGDVVEVWLGEAWGVPTLDEDNVKDGTESQVVYGRGRLDEADTRDGFESYGVIGQFTDPNALPRYLEDVPDGEGGCSPCAGDLIAGTAWYWGNFNATVFEGGNVLSDTASGWVEVGLDFANATASISMEGEYTYDDLDDKQPQFVVGINYSTVTIDGIDYVASVTPVYGDPIDTTNVVTGLNVTKDIAGHVTNVAAVYGDVANTNDIVTGINVVPASTGDITGVVRNITVNYGYDHDDTYNVELSSVGDSSEISFANGQVTYTGALQGSVEIPTDYGSTWYDVGGVDDNGTEDPADDVAYGQYAGAVFGPGADAYADAVVEPGGDPYEPSFNEITAATATAGVFEAGSELDEGHDDGNSPTVEIVGGFGASLD